MLGAALWPAPAMSTVGVASGLGYAFLKVVDIHQADKEQKTGKPTVRSKWVPLDTRDWLQTRMENVEADVAQAEEEVKLAEQTGDKVKIKEAKDDLEVAKKKVVSMRKWKVACERVGVWTDDYSNLLSVFLLSEED